MTQNKTLSQAIAKLQDNIDAGLPASAIPYVEYAMSLISEQDRRIELLRGELEIIRVDAGSYAEGENNPAFSGFIALERRAHNAIIATSPDAEWKV